MNTLIKQIEGLVKKREVEIHVRIIKEKYSASQSYIDDLKGYKRGISEMGREILNLIETHTKL